MVGQTISHYKIIEKLGEGGMGVVYKAEDTKLKRTVALKFLPPELTRNEEAKERFIHEAQAASALDHPNVCTVFEIGETDDGQMYMAIAYYEGETLKKRIESGPMKIEEALDVAIQVASGLTKAHESGIVHRDIKPANVIITKDGVAKILDFGLAKLGGRTLFTKSGTTLGTVAYMSPEQARGESVDARTDVWSLGIVLYEMITGQRPFRGEYEQAVIYSLLNLAPEPVTSLRTGIPLEFEMVIKKCLEKDASNRYQHADEILVDLRRLKGETSKVTPSVTAVPPLLSKVQEKRKVRRIVWIGAATILLTAAIIIFLLLRPTGVKLNPNYSIRNLYTCSYQTGGAGIPLFTYPGISRDGNWVSFGAPDDSGKWDLYFMNVSWPEPRKIALRGSRDVSGAKISPNGELILFGSQGQSLQAVSSNGGEIRNVGDTTALFWTWSPDGNRIGYMVSTERGLNQRLEIRSVRKDGTEKRLELVDSIDLPPSFYNIAFCWSPDGESIAWTRNFPAGYIELFSRNLKTGKERQLTFDRKIVDEPSWLSNGNIVFMSDRSGIKSIWVVPAEGGEPRQITAGAAEQLTVMVSEDGKRLLIPEVEVLADIWITDMSSANPPQIKLDHFVSVLGFAASGDMQKFAFSKYEPPEGHALYVVNREGKNRVRLVVNKHSMFLPEFSPDGKWIAYLIPDQDVDNVSVVKSDEPGPPRTVTVPHLFGGVGNSISWIDSQNFVVFNGEMKTFVCSVLGGEPKQLFFEDSTWAEPILGGKYMVYQDFRKGREGRWIAPVDPQGKLSGKPTRFLSAVTAFRSPDSRIWIYEKHPGEVWRITLPGGKEERWGKLPPLLKLRQFMRVILSDDGKRLAYMTHGVTLKLVLLENVFE